MTGVPEKAIFRSVTVYNTILSSQCNLSVQIEPLHDTNTSVSITSHRCYFIVPAMYYASYRN
jgi:hypothetical protein